LVLEKIEVLVVEDEALIALELETALQEGGFSPVCARDAETALLKLEDMKFGALVTDINLTGEMTGWDLAHRARELNPDIPVVYVTSISLDEWKANGVPHSILISKPFAPSQIRAAVSDLLNTSD
jgi:DNA-binding response OmpR family regulator